METKRLHPVMLAGTGSDVGKSVLAAALCRILRQDGYRPAPFKAQNMALNSYVTADGMEIGRAQAVQAEAAGIPCEADMNPILLKPNSDHTSQVVLLGKPIGNRDAYDYFRREGREQLRTEAHRAFDRLARRFFRPEEQEALALLEGDRRAESFFRLWTIKESYLKYTGRGIGGGLSSFRIDFENRLILPDQGGTAAFRIFTPECLKESYVLSLCAGSLPASIPILYKD